MYVFRRKLLQFIRISKVTVRKIRSLQKLTIIINKSYRFNTRIYFWLAIYTFGEGQQRVEHSSLHRWRYCTTLIHENLCINKKQLIRIQVPTISTMNWNRKLHLSIWNNNLAVTYLLTSKPTPTFSNLFN